MCRYLFSHLCAKGGSPVSSLLLLNFKLVDNWNDSFDQQIANIATPIVLVI